MKHKKYFLASAIALMMSFQVQAQNANPAILSNIKTDIGATAANNIENSERLFCYQVSEKPRNYTGYTLNNMAITGFCGVIDDNLRNMLTEQLLATAENIDFIKTESCTIQPKILLRYVRGVDNTDVLLSAPCHSISIFYSGAVKSYNMRPAQELLNTVVNAFKSSQAKFVSPALLNQLLPIGVAQTAEQKAMLNQGAQPKRNWSTPAAQPTNNGAANGWNSLNFSK